MRKFLSAIVAAMILLSFGACKKGEKQPVSQVPLKQGPIIETPNMQAGHEVDPKGEFQIVVPPEVKGKWAAVTFIVEDRKLNRTHEFTVKLGGELKIPNSNLKVKVGDFLPDFKMNGLVITSSSNTPNNPSVGVIIFEGDKQIFPEKGKWGWLYAQFPSIHPFQHERYGLILKEGIKKQ